MEQDNDQASIIICGNDITEKNHYDFVQDIRNKGINYKSKIAGNDYSKYSTDELWFLKETTKNEINEKIDKILNSQSLLKNYKNENKKFEFTDFREFTPILTNKDYEQNLNTKNHKESILFKQIENNTESKDYQLKVGDFVKVKEWDDMVKQYGLTSAGYIHVAKKEIFCDGMKGCCGRIYPIKKINEDRSFCLDGEGWIFIEEMVKKLEEFIEDQNKTTVEVPNSNQLSYGNVINIKNDNYILPDDLKWIDDDKECVPKEDNAQSLMEVSKEIDDLKKVINCHINENWPLKQKWLDRYNELIAASYSKKG